MTVISVSNFKFKPLILILKRTRKKTLKKKKYGTFINRDNITKSKEIKGRK